MPILDGILDQIVQDENSLFRLWLTTLPSDKFPVTVVQNGVKATLEPPQGMRNNLIRSYRNVITNKEFDDCEKPEAFKRLFFGLCFFNALILERRKFGPLGWNIPYSFAMSDLRISKQQLSLYLNEFVKIPYDALNYMVAKANYGGRVTDSQDKRTISIILAEYFNESVVNVDDHPLTPSGTYRVPPDMERSGYIEFCESLPLDDSTEIFGMHPNAEITSNINSTNALMATALSLLPNTAVSGGKSRDD
jgi:dynein heavy chain